MNDEERIALVDLADELQVRKQRIFKILPRLGIRPVQRREASRGNQAVATLTAKEAAAIRAELTGSTAPSADGNDRPMGLSMSDDFGVFYLIQLEPAHDPGRFKVGFTAELEGRLRKHRCSAPFATVLQTWRCRRTWERAAIDCTTEGCEQLHTEVFRTDAIPRVIDRANAFFDLMPKSAVAPETDDVGKDAGQQQTKPPSGTGPSEG